ncbi:MAG: lytic transglycosylase domain-containing protein [Paludibacteraceae bacterium]
MSLPLFSDLLGITSTSEKKNEVWDIVEYAKKLLGMSDANLYRGYNLDLISLSDKVLSNKYLFLRKLVDICIRLEIQPNWLMGIMWYESRLNPAAKNPKGSATGLIQFVESTANFLGTTTSKLRTMTNVQQLDYVYRYFLPYKGKLHTLYDCYAVVFFPLLIGKPENWIIKTSKLSASYIAKSNPAIKDLNKDGVLSVSEFRKYVDSIIPLL